MTKAYPQLQIIRDASAQSGFLKRIFTQGANGISPAQITMEMRVLLRLSGIEIPTGVLIGLDTAQIILAGGAVARDLATGLSTLQLVGDVTMGVGGVALLLSDLGLLDPEVADFASLGSNLALAIASSGANVLADIGVVLSLIACVGDVGRNLFGSPQDAELQARRALAFNVRNYLIPEIKAASEVVHAYSKGVINVFDLIGQIATKAPYEFPSLFPGIAAFFPSWVPITLVGRGKSSGLWSDSTAEYTAVLFLNQIKLGDLKAELIDEYLVKPMLPFEQFRTVAPVISLTAVSVLAMLLATSTKGDIAVTFDFNILGAMRGLGLTPSKLGDDWLFKGLQRNETDLSDWDHHLPYPPITLSYVRHASSGVEINGVPSLSANEATQDAQAGELEKLQRRMQHLDAMGDIESLLKIPEAVAMLKRWATVHVEPVFYTAAQCHAEMTDYETRKAALSKELAQVQVEISRTPMDAQTVQALAKEIASLVKPSTPVGEIVNMRRSGVSITRQPWFKVGMSTDPGTIDGALFWEHVRGNYVLDLSDYWKCLQTLNQLRKANFTKDSETVVGYHESMNAIETQFQATYSYFLAKQLNVIARQELAKRLKVPTESLQTRLDSKGQQIFYSKGA